MSVFIHVGVLTQAGQHPLVLFFSVSDDFAFPSIAVLENLGGKGYAFGFYTKQC